MPFPRTLAMAIPFLLIAQMPALAEPAQADIAITLGYYEQDIQWNASYQSFSFNGTLTLDDPLNREIDVSLYVVPPAGWSATCEPAINKFYHPGERGFTCTARYPFQATNMSGNITVHGVATWRGDTVATNQSWPFAVRLTRLPVEKYTNLTNPHKIDFTTRLENILPHLAALAVIVAAAVAGVAAWRWRRRRREAGP